LRDWLILAVILVAALGLRVMGLDQQLWFDELDTLDSHLRLPWGRMMEVYSMNHHYLYSFEAKALMGPLGEAPWVIRLPAMLFGVAGVAALWWLAREIAGVTIAHVSAALLAVSFNHIWFSQNARGYTELAFFATIGTGLFPRAIVAATARGALAFALALALCVFTHLTGALLFLAIGLVWLGLLVTRGFPMPLLRWGLIAFSVGGALALFAYMPLVLSLMDTVSSVGAGTEGSGAGAFGSPVWTITEGVRGVFGGLGPTSVFAAALAGALIVLGGLRGRAPAGLFGAIIIVHIVLALALLRLIGARIWPRFFLPDLEFVLVLLTIGARVACTTIARRVAPRAEDPLFCIAVAAMLAASLALALRNYAAPKQDLTGAIAAANALRRPDERVYAVRYAAGMFTGHYGQRWGTIWDSADYRREMTRPGPVLLVVGFPRRVFAEVPELARDDAAGRLTEVRRLPGTLADGAIVILRRQAGRDQSSTVCFSNSRRCSAHAARSMLPSGWTTSAAA
jgi:hypothetical protein